MLRYTTRLPFLESNPYLRQDTRDEPVVKTHRVVMASDTGSCMPRCPQSQPSCCCFSFDCSSPLLCLHAAASIRRIRISWCTAWSDSGKASSVSSQCIPLHQQTSRKYWPAGTMTDEQSAGPKNGDICMRCYAALMRGPNGERLLWKRGWFRFGPRTGETASISSAVHSMRHRLSRQASRIGVYCAPHGV